MRPRGAAEPVVDRGPLGACGQPLDEDPREVRAVEFAQQAVERLRIADGILGRGDEHDVRQIGDIAERRAPRDDRDALARAFDCDGTDRVGAQQGERRARRVVRAERARCARRRDVAAVGQARHFAQHLGKLLRAHMPGTQQRRETARQIEDGRLDADLRGAAVEHGDRIAELLAHMLRRRRAHMAETIRRRPATPPCPSRKPSNARSKACCDRVRRTAQADRILAAADHVGNMRRTLQDQCQRAGPERLDEQARGMRQGTDPVARIAVGRDMDDHRVRRGAALRRVDPRHRVDILGVRAKSIDCLGRNASNSPRFSNAAAAAIPAASGCRNASSCRVMVWTSSPPSVYGCGTRCASSSDPRRSLHTEAHGLDHAFELDAQQALAGARGLLRRFGRRGGQRDVAHLAARARLFLRIEMQTRGRPARRRPARPACSADRRGTTRRRAR